MTILWMAVGCVEPTSSVDTDPVVPDPDTPVVDTTDTPDTVDTATGWGEPCGPRWPVGVETNYCVPDFTLPDADGNPVTVSDYRGDHVLVVDLVAMWCGPCFAMADDLELLHQKYADQGLEIITLLGEDVNSQNPTVADAASWRDAGKISHPVVADVDGTVKWEWSRAPDFFNIPMTYVVDTNGTLVFFSSDAENGIDRLEEIVQLYLPKPSDTK